MILHNRQPMQVFLSLLKAPIQITISEEEDWTRSLCLTIQKLQPWPAYSNQSAAMTYLLQPISCHDPLVLTHQLPWSTFFNESATMTCLF